ncbi:helix-turn-helix domain-containing protein [Halorientalis salina]|uniref:helix-turn-helix domain-containing protein n=1 Tax=Halorientalis salina TaxID=2932266 RepID=UPI0010AC402B|nr:helix-turn-helix domain-containing protein [Halorientalis salina]
MSLIAEYTLSNPILRETRRAVPSVEVEVEDEQPTTTNPSQLVFWARGDEADLDRFFEALPADPSIRDFEILSSAPERYLFRATLSPNAEQGMTYVDAIQSGITFLEIKTSGEGVEYRAEVPDRESLSAYREQCQERGLTFELRRLYRSEHAVARGYGLTDRQRDVLGRALEQGYFEVPRNTSVSELADEFDVSSQALSALLRRGQATLLENTIG